MFGRSHIRNLEARIEELEQRLDARVWELPPRNDIPIEDLPTFPDYSTPNPWYCDEDDEWNAGCASPFGYL